MGTRLGILNGMRSQGRVGEGNKGLLVQRGNLTGGEIATFSAENADRRIVIRGMATAIVKINKIEPTPENISSILLQAAEQFAAVRIDRAEPGWWIQLPDGRWAQK